MDGGFPVVNCLLQHTLRSLCSAPSVSSNSPPKWVYSVFWRILPRNYPPPKWDYGGGVLDRSRGNKRNWILVWEDGFCDFSECERARNERGGRFGADVFFKMSHEVYSYGEGLVGKVAAENSHRWVYRYSPNELDPSFVISPWNLSIDPQPRAWEFQFSSGIQTIAIISVREGVIQLGSFDKITEDLNLVISTQRKFSYIQSIPGIFSLQRPYLPLDQPPNAPPLTIGNIHETAAVLGDNEAQFAGTKRICGGLGQSFSTNNSFNFGWNTPQIGGFAGAPEEALPPPLSAVSGSFGGPIQTALFENGINNGRRRRMNNGGAGRIKVESGCGVGPDGDGEPINPHLGVEGSRKGDEDASKS